MEISSWKFYPIPYVHVLETTAGLSISMVLDKDYRLSVKLMDKMLRHKLEVPPNPVGNDRTHAEQLIRLFQSRIRAHRDN